MDRIDNSVPRVTAWHQEALLGITRLCRLMPNSDLRVRVVYPIQKASGFFFLHTFGCQRFNESSFTFKYLAFTSAILNKTDVILTFLCCRLMTKLRDVHKTNVKK